MGRAEGSAVGNPAAGSGPVDAPVLGERGPSGPEVALAAEHPQQAVVGTWLVISDQVTRGMSGRQVSIRFRFTRFAFLYRNYSRP